MSEAARKMPVSIQNYGTPEVFLLAVRRRFVVYDFAYDLAAETENAKAEHFFCEEEDSLAQDWTKIDGDLWLNPPFGNISPWAAKCADYGRRGTGRLFFLTPASVGANWFAEHIWTSCVSGQAMVYALQGRLSFDGKAPYPKDCMLTVWAPGRTSGFDVWDWRQS
jgi:site-specific DNA-methyltransferase (adenine-specific)